MLFKKKEYICVPLSEMHVYEERPTNIISNVSYNNATLSDGTEVKLFFEYTQKNIREGIAKEFITGTLYKRSFGFKLTPGTLYSEQTKTSCIDYDTSQFKTVNSSEVKQYLKKLKSEKLYKEYLEKIKQFYHSAIIINNNQEELNGRTK